MKFHVEQQIEAPPDAVAGAFADAAFYESLGAFKNLAAPEVLERRQLGDAVHLRVRYRFTGDLNPAARAVLDPARLSWVEDATHDLAAHHVVFRMDADHYADRFRAHGSYRFVAHDAGTRRIAVGEVVIRTPIVGRRVERAIVSGIEEHIHEETALVEAFLNR